jgi:hypothetical protein
MSNPPEQTNLHDEQEGTSSPIPAGRLWPVILVTTSAIAIREYFISDPPEPSSSPHEHKTTDSPVPAGQLSPATRDITPTVSIVEPSLSDPPNLSSPLRVSETMSLQAPNEPQQSPAITNTTPTVSTAESSLSDQPEPGSLAHEHGATVSNAPAEPRLPFTGLNTLRTIPETLESGVQLSTEPVWVPQDSSQIRAPPPPSSPASSSRVVKLPPTPSSPAFVSRLVKLPPTPKPSPVFPIMKLPPELRLMVFDQLFLDLTVRRQRSMMFRNEVKLLEKYQVNDFRPYTNLLLTCKELGQEAKKHWMTIYLHQCCFYFWQVSKLYDLSLILEKLGKPYTEIKYVLRSECDEGHVGDFCLATTVRKLMADENVDFMSCQPGVPPDYHDTFMEQLFDRMDLEDVNGDYVEIRAGTYEATEEKPVRSVVWIDEADRMIACAEWSGPESCEISANAVQAAANRDNPWGLTFRHFQEMQGKFSGIFWGGYDAAVGYGKLKIWDMMPSCHGPDHHHCQKWDDPANGSIREELLLQIKNERTALVRRWASTIMADSKWLSLGGKSDEFALGVVDGYGLEEWFMDELWSGGADHHFDHWYPRGEPWTAIRLPQ